MKRIFLITTALVLAGTIAQAEVTTRALANDYMVQGYDKVEVKRGATQIRVEAIRAGQKVRVVYDIASGAVISNQTSPASQSEQSESGVEVSSGSDDFGADDTGRGSNHAEQHSGGSTADGNDDNHTSGGNDDNRSSNDSQSSGGNDNSGGNDSHGSGGNESHNSGGNDNGNGNDHDGGDRGNDSDD